MKLPSAYPLGVNDPATAIPNHTVKEGPPDTPECLLQSAEHERFGIQSHPRDRFHRAFKAGFWALSPSVGLSFCLSSHWLVWSSQGISERVRFTELAIAERLFASLPRARVGGARYLVGFVTFYELHQGLVLHPPILGGNAHPWPHGIPLSLERLPLPPRLDAVDDQVLLPWLLKGPVKTTNYLRARSMGCNNGSKSCHPRWWLNWRSGRRTTGSVQHFFNIIDCATIMACSTFRSNVVGTLSPHPFHIILSKSDRDATAPLNLKAPNWSCCTATTDHPAVWPSPDPSMYNSVHGASTSLTHL